MMYQPIDYVYGQGKVGRAMMPSNFQCQGVLQIWIIVGQGPIVFAVRASGGGLDIFVSSIISFLSRAFWETVRCRLNYCLKVPLKSQTYQPT